MNEPSPTLAEIAASLRRVAAEVDAARDANDGDFAPMSPALEDWAANELPGGWGPQPLQDAYRTAELYGASVNDHLLALADVIERNRPFAIVSLARALVEPAARAIWLLEPGLDPLERVRRLVNDILYAAFEHETLWADEPRVASNDDIYVKIADEATARDLAYTPRVRDPKARRYAPARLGEPRPTSQALLAYATKSPRMAKYYYRAASATTHGALHSFDQRLAYSATAPNRVKVADVDSDAVLRDGTFAMQTYVAYVGALMYQTAWPDERVLAAVDELEEMWQRIAARAEERTTHS